MKTPEDEAFDELAQRQGDWGGGFEAKRKAVMDKINADFDEEYIKYRAAFPKEYTAAQVLEDQAKYGASWLQDGKRIDPMSVYKEQPAQEPHEYDWSMLEAAKESLREHMARIKELEAALAQPEQGPVALVIDGVLVKSALPEKYTGHLYTISPHPAQDVDYWIREATAARQAEMALRRELEAKPVQEPVRLYVENFATKCGWKKEEGEGAFEYVQRKSYAQGLEDATPPPPAQEPAGMLHIERLDKWLDASLKEQSDRHYEAGWNSALEMAAHALETEFSKAFGKDTLKSIAVYIKGLKK